MIWNNIRIVSILLAGVIVAGCSKGPEPEKVVVKKAPVESAPAHPHGSEASSETSDSGNLGASHQQEGAQMQSAQSEAISESAPPPGEPITIEAREGFRIEKSVDGMGRGTIHFLVPEEWQSSQPSSSMRIGQFTLPGDAGPAELAIFGPMGGTTRQNLDRWIDQVNQPDGSSSREKAKEEQLQGDRFTSTFLDVSGTYLGMQMQGDEPKANYRIVGSIVETPAGPWFFKATGPHDTLEKWIDGFRVMTTSVQIESGSAPAGSGSYH